MRKGLLTIMTLTVASIHAQEAWTVWRCMQYAVEHNHEVKRAELELDSYKATRVGAIGRFLPEVDASIGAQYNFGRAINPETNGYTDVSTFYNGYSVSATLSVFDGFSRLHALKAAKAGVLLGHASLRLQQDQTALQVLQAFANAAYYESLVKMAEERVEETTLLLRQTRALEEVGRKCATDVAQVESQKAEADYELTRQENLLASAMLELKKEMGYPLEKSLGSLSSLSPNPSPKERGVYSSSADSSADSSAYISNYTPLLGRGVGGEAGEAAVAHHQVEVSKHEWRQARAALFPSLSLGAGLGTTYYRTLHTQSASSFSNQLKNNMGEYVGATLHIPLFNRLQTITSIRRAKNNYLMARENYEQKLLELEKQSREAWQDWQGFQLQAVQMAKKVEADSLAYQLTRRQFEEGLSTAIDLRTTATQLLQSRATLLQCQLMAMVKREWVRYYNGEKIWTE